MTGSDGNSCACGGTIPEGPSGEPRPGGCPRVVMSHHQREGNLPRSLSISPHLWITLPGMETTEAQTFELPGSAATSAYWQLAGAGGLVLLSVVNFVVALRTNVTMLKLQLGCTAPMVAAIFLFGTAIRALRMAVLVRITPGALEIRHRSGSVLVLPWQQIVLVNTGSPPMTTKKHLTLHDARGKVLARLSEDFQDFPGMETAIRAHQIPSPQQAAVKRGQGRRKGVFFMAFGVVFIALAVVNGWIALKDRRDQELFQKLGRSTEATIVRQFIAPDGRTHRIEFRVDDVPDAPVVNVEVNEILWMVMTPGRHMAVIAVPGRPDLAHLTMGEIADNFAPPFGIMLPASIAVGLFAMAIFVLGILVFRGMQAKWI